MFFDDLNDCLEKGLMEKCNTVILEIENSQIDQYEKGNFKCQTSLLGLQTEIISRVYGSQNNRDFGGFTIPSVIKNC